jgi:hypothetical protein
LQGGKSPDVTEVAGGFGQMGDIQKFAARVIDLAERVSAMADAASGSRSLGGRNGISGRVVDLGERLADVGDAAHGSSGRGGMRIARWILLPAAGAAAYAFARNETVARQTKEVVDEAKTRASELPNDLLKNVQSSSGSASKGSASRSRTKRSTSSRRSSSGKTKSSR